ncbi:MAG: TolC family protein [Pseudomonadota bacterium]
MLSFPKILPFLLCGLPMVAAAQPSTLTDLEAALRAHPRLDALSLRAGAQRDRGIAATALPDPEITLGLNNFPVFDPSFTEYLPTNKSIGLRQRLPNRGRLLADRDEATARAAQLDAVRVSQFAELRADMLVQLVTRKRVEDQLKLLDARLERYAELDDVVLAEVDAGQPSLFRLAEIEGERAEVERRSVALQAEARRADARLRELLGFVPDAVTISPELRVWPGNTRLFHAVRVAQEAVDIAKSRIEAAESDFETDWALQATYHQRENGRNFDGDDWMSFGVTMTVPLWKTQKLKPRLRAAQADRSAALADVQVAARNALAQYEALDAERVAAREAARLIEGKIKTVEQALADRLIVYESGTGGYAPIIDGEIAVLALQSEIASEQAREVIAIVRMNGLHYSADTETAEVLP